MNASAVDLEEKAVPSEDGKQVRHGGEFWKQVDLIRDPSSTDGSRQAGLDNVYGTDQPARCVVPLRRVGAAGATPA